MGDENAQILLPTEAEAYVQAINKFEVKEIGSPRWVQQHEYLEKLNMQAVLNASAMEDEFIKEFLITYEKIPVLIHELICTSLWKQKVFPEFIELELEQSVMFPVYMVLYHEATVINLLETVMYHQDSCTAAEDAILDMLDYCIHNLSSLCWNKEAAGEEDEEESTDVLAALQTQSESSSLEELQKQEKKIRFDICMKTVSLLRYITDHITSLPLSVCTRLLNTHDVAILLVELITSPPWTKSKKGKLVKYVDNKWQQVAESDRFRLTKLDGQVWIAIFHVLMDQECQQRYDITSTRKNTILKLRGHLNELVVDQIPILGELQRYLEQLSFMDPPPAKTDLILEQVPEIQETILKQNKGKWSQIARYQSENYFNPKKIDMKAQARRLAEMYNLDALENLVLEPPKCALCGELASKRCSRCQNEWYCRRECQVQHWKKHKKACDMLRESVDKVNTMTTS